MKPSNRIKLTAAVIAGLVVWNAEATAEITKFYGHDIVIKEAQAGEKALLIDGKPVLTDGIISLDELMIVAGQTVLIGSNASGGNACGESPFFISFPATGNPRVDGPLDTCSMPEINNKGDRLVLTQPPRVASAGEKWAWSPAKGIEHLETTPFTADSSKGWANLRERRIETISDILANGEITDTIDRLLGQDMESFRSYATGPALGGEYDSANNFYAINCVAHNCDSDQALVYLDYSKRQVFVAWKAYEKPIVVRPAVGEWPDKAKFELKTWAKKYK